MADTPKSVNAFGVASSVFGILSLLVCWIPLLNFLVIPLGLTGLALGIAGVITSLLGRRSGLGWPVTGLTMCVCAFLVAFTMWLLFASAVAVTGVALAGAGAANEAPVREERPAIEPPTEAPPSVGVGGANPPVAARVKPDDGIRTESKNDPFAEINKEAERKEAERMRKFHGEEAERIQKLHGEFQAEQTQRALSELEKQAAQLFRLAQNLDKAGKTKGAITFYRRIVRDYALTPQAEKAQKRIDLLLRDHPE